MTREKELIKELRWCAKNDEFAFVAQKMIEATEKIESLVAENTQLKFELQQLRDKPVKKSVFATCTEAFRISDIIHFEKCTRLNGKFALVLWLHSQEDLVYIDGNSEAINGYFEELCRNMED